MTMAETIRSLMEMKHMAWGVGFGPREYGESLMNRRRKKLKGWQRQALGRKRRH